EGDHRGKRNRPEVMNILRMKETVDAFVPGDDSAGKDGKEYRSTSQVLYTTIPKCKTVAWVLAREYKSDAEGNGSRGMSEIVNRVREECDAAGSRNAGDLEQR